MLYVDEMIKNNKKLSDYTDDEVLSYFKSGEYSPMLFNVIMDRIRDKLSGSDIYEMFLNTDITASTYSRLEYELVMRLQG